MIGARTLRLLAVGAALLVVYAATVSAAPLNSVIAVAGGPPPSVATKPPLGWNSWNAFGCDIDESKIRAAADSLVSSGMRDVGYRYVVIDDCWFDPRRDGAGRLRADPRRFPSGIRALADYVHALGLKLGIYETPASRTCAQYSGGYPGSTGSAGHERQDARTFSGWGVDYLKYDWCSTVSDVDSQVAAFVAMRDALRATGRPILYGINPNSYAAGEPGERYDWGAVANLTRTTQDVLPRWRAEPGDTGLGVAEIIAVNGSLTARTGPGHWDDADALEIGVPGTEGFPGLNAAEQRTQFGMWAMMSAPLIAGNELTTMSAPVRGVLTNPGVIAVDQDPLGRAGRPVAGTAGTVWLKPLAGGSVAVAMYNPGPTWSKSSIGAGRLGVRTAGGYRVSELWTGRQYAGTATLSQLVPPHGTSLLRVTPFPG